MKTKLNIKKDDRVLVTTGKEKGKVGKVLKVDPAKGKALVEKVNLIKRHSRPTKGSKGGVVEKEGPLNLSNLMLLCPKCNEPVRAARRPLGEGKSARYCKKCEEFMDS
ncbi:MAG: 50S ribosomal protein L24 [Desulfarculus sp.]|jgi:large subunit ribosomal protein L24|nr:MAG: 50S ribosomal protein L24 [Desulfarculus sp.]